MRALAFLALLAAPAWGQDRPVIVADSYAVAQFAQALAGDAAEVRLAVPEGRDPASWRPSLSEIVEIQAADLIVLNGAGLSDWTTRAALPRSRTVDTARTLSDALIATDTITHSHGAEGSHSHEGIDPHIWLDLDLAAEQAEALAAAMARALPDGPVAANLDALLAELDRLDAAGDALVEGMPVPAITSHPRYAYLGRAYGLQVTELDWGAGVAPEAAQLAELERAAAETGARLLIWEAEPPAAARDAVAALGLAQAVVPALAIPPAEGDFVSAVEAGLVALAEALAAVSP
ncbi:metal ABC transporter substrate-binding protein [Jannaschia seohaensis]|uniref:High-affinity zinc uptake system protein ZnuA n=1 Tax=Jannaschia seohaensis TaxID=475081 RepID=A0A2Y9AWH1_9RHOB|nr:metal ABC transporter substrate-binding protein [Jannaschia seohaensis]PWJ17537.1 zinc transport system substrate-binding protein [Jannaschia seohaensis]SSA47678.1 zinc transport system substrate-binding protein [Jannaschia seohaensis]